MSKKVALTNVRVFDGERIGDPSTVVIDGDVIGTNATNADEHIDCNGQVLLPGLIDCHVHVVKPKNIDALTSYGITTALDMGCYPSEIMATVRAYAETNHLTDILTPFASASAPGSLSSLIGNRPAESLLRNPQMAKDFVAARVKEGSDYIKVLADVPGPTQEVLNALQEASRAHGKLLIAHATSHVPYLMALEADVEVLTHVPMDQTLEDDAVQNLAKKKGKAVIPTLIMMQGMSKIRTNSHYRNAHDTVVALHKAGIPIFVGTDSSEAPAPAGVKFGSSMLKEMELLFQAGMSTVEILRGATEAPAAYFGLKDRGAIKPGMRADLMLVAGDPVQDIKALAKIQSIWCRGVEIPPHNDTPIGVVGKAFEYVLYPVQLTIARIVYRVAKLVIH